MYENYKAKKKTSTKLDNRLTAWVQETVTTCIISTVPDV